GTYLVHDLVSGAAGSEPVSLVASLNKLFFTAYHPTSGRELYCLETPSVLPTKLTNFLTAEPIRKIVNLGDSLILFTAIDDVLGLSLWKSDGTSNGTEIIDQLMIDTHLFVTDFGVFFVNSDSAHGVEVWFLDESLSAIHRITDIFPGPSGSVPGHFSMTNNALFFSAYNPGVGKELWKIDFTELSDRKSTRLNYSHVKIS